jgi:hypothetical protein
MTQILDAEVQAGKKPSAIVGVVGAEQGDNLSGDPLVHHFPARYTTVL